MSEAGLTRGQKRARLHALRGKNVFITGGSGTGKSACLMSIVRELEASGKKALVCAPTGSAALRVGAMTIHSLFGFPPEACINPGGKKREPSIKVRVPKVLKTADAVAIDEISLVRLDVFDAVVSSIEKAEEESGHHIQLIVAGDFAQLSPIIGEGFDKDILESFYGTGIGGAYAFQGRAWDRCRFYTVVLDEVVRQKESGFIDALNRIRVGDPEGLEYINSVARRTIPDGILSLYAYRQPVDDANRRQLLQLDGPARTFRTVIDYVPGFPGGNSTSKVFDSVPKDLILKEGAVVTFTSNDRTQPVGLLGKSGDPWLLTDKDKGCYVNGMSGTVLSIPDGCVSEPRPVIVKTETGKVIEVCPVTQPIYRYVEENGELVKRKIATYTQLPLMLGYSVTIHHAQGQTYERIILCPDTFAAGQLYVALSRVRTMDGLYLTRAMRPRDIIVDPAVMDFYNSLRDGLKPQKVGRPIQDGAAKTRMIWVPMSLEEHIRQEIRSNRIIPLEKMPAYQEGRVHKRIQESLYDEVKAQIDQWKSSCSKHA